MTSAFIPVGALGNSFAAEANLIDSSTELNGRSFAFDIDLFPSLSIGEGTGSWGDNTAVPVRVSSIRSNIYLVDGVHDTVSTSFVLDLAEGLVTIVESELPDADIRQESAFSRVQRGAELTGVTARFYHGRIDGSQATPHTLTNELVGMRNRYTYSPTEQYEHVYLNEKFYSWHCLAGAELGLADTDACHFVGIAPQLTLFVWREKIVPTLGLVLIDLDSLRTDGKIFGNDGFDASSFTNFPIGAIIDVLNTTHYTA